jgi:hypothetical protein
MAHDLLLPRMLEPAVEIAVLPLLDKTLRPGDGLAPGAGVTSSMPKYRLFVVPQ